MLKRKKTLSKLLATTMVLTSFTVNASAAEVNTSTIGGNDRYETAIKISENGWSSSDRAVLINGEKGLVDALTATPYAYAKNAPILITGQGKLTTSTKNRLSAMNVKNVDIVGGVNSVSNQVVNELKNMGITVNRISGASRYDTSLAVAKEVDKIQDVSEIAVVNGDKGIPDAVSVAAPAASKKMPILLAENGGLNSASKDFVNGESVSKSYVIGSSNSVSDTVMNSLPGTKTRLGGADRHDTNAAVIKEFYTASSLSNVYVAKSGYVKNNDEIVDALAAGVLAAKNGNPVVLVGNSINPSQQTLLAGKKFTKLTQIGMGVPANSVNQIKATQADEESAVNSVSVVDYKTIKVTGKLLDKLSASSFSVSGNSVSSYSPNTAGTEATIAFSKAFDANNTLSVTSNLGKVTTHTFTYNTNITSVQASTKEVGKSGLQYLEVTVNGSEKRSVKQLNEQGWKVEFTSNEEVFYGGDNATFKKTSTDGKLRTSFAGLLFNTFNYEVKLTKGNTVIPSAKGYVDIVDRASVFKSIDSFELSKPSNIAVPGKDGEYYDLVLKNTAVVGETLNIINFKATNKDGSETKYPTLKGVSNIDVKSSAEDVVRVQRDGDDRNTLKAVKKGTATITITDGTLSKTLNITVSENKRVATKITPTAKTANIANNNTVGETVTLVVKDQYDDIFDGEVDFVADSKILKNNTSTDIANVNNKKFEPNEKGEVSLQIVPIPQAVGTGKLLIKDSKNVTTLSTITVNIGELGTVDSYRFELDDKSADNKLDLYDDKDKSVVYNLNEYSGNFFVSSVDKKNISTGKVDKNIKYSVVATDSTIVKVSTIEETSKIKIEGLKKGSTTVKVYKNGNVDNTKTITINVYDNTPTITNVDFKDIDTITKAGDYDVLSSVLDITQLSDDSKIVGGISLTGKGGNVIFTNTDLKVDLTTVGILKVTSNFTEKITINNNNQVKLEDGAKGIITVEIYTKRNSSGDVDGTGSPITKLIEVDVPTTASAAQSK